VDNLMTVFSKRRSSIACVVDEFGSTTGVITMEDILEQIFGDIEDEHDQEDYTEIEVNDHEFIFSGRLEIDYLNEKYVSKLAFPEGEYTTLSGYIVTTTTTIPEQGSELELEGYRFIFESVGDKKIETIRVVNLRGE
jgi:putative hemolysin